MRLFNQTKNPLRWDMGGQSFECEPYGTVVIDDVFRDPVRSRGLPLGPLPVPPELKAQQRVAEVTAATRDELVDGLREQATKLQFEITAAKHEAELQGVALDEANGRAKKLEGQLRATKAEGETISAERTAAESLLNEQAGAQSDELKALITQAATATAARQAAEDVQKKAVEEAEQLREQLRLSRDEIEAMRAAHERLGADKRASDELLDETAKSATANLARADQAEKRLADLMAKKQEKRSG